jgi:HEAT repeat protein
MKNRTQDSGWLRWLVTAIFLLVAFTTSVVSQTGSTGRFATFKQLLRERNIELTQDALLSALGNSDPHIRYLAALVLAEDKAKDAIPAVTAALRVEDNSEARVNLALALAQLGSESGAVSLREDCDNVRLGALLRMYAAKYLLDLHTEFCLNSIETVLKSAPDSGSRVLALSQLPRFQHISTAESQTIFDLVVAALSDREPTVRIGASHSLVALENLSAVPSLEHAIQVERDEATRSIMAADLRLLQEKGPATEPVR